MEKDERRKIANIIEAFSKINQDIRSAFNKVSESLSKIKDFNGWKKEEAGKQKTRKGYSDDDDLPGGIRNWYYLNYYGEYKGKVVGFTFAIGVEYDKEDEKEYLELINVLDKDINPNTPMLLISGIYETAGKINKAKITDDNNWHYVDEVLRITVGWEDFNEKNVSLNKWMDVTINYDGEDENYLKEMGWYKSARVKIMHISDIESEEKAEKVINDLISEAKQYRYRE